jgi:hypothetical protein
VEAKNCTCVKICPVHDFTAVVVHGSKKCKSTMLKKTELLTSMELRTQLALQEQKKQDEKIAKEARVITRKENQITNELKVTHWSI